MTRLAPVLLAAFGLMACTDPALNVGLTFGTGGVAVSPSVSAGVGGARVSVSP